MLPIFSIRKEVLCFYKSYFRCMSSALELQIKTLPNSPGVYQYFDKKDVIIYVGKAKNLKKRVSSYFTKNHEYGKTRVLVKKIVRIEHIVVDTETDALLLENNLIKKYQPRYNVMLKDDKTYPWLCIKKERFPRVFMTRNVIKDGSEYFGPYTNVRTVKALLDLIKELYALRTCNYDLSQAKIDTDKYKVCLEYHLGNCKGPCEGLQTEEEYHQDIREIRNIIKGNFKESLQKFEKIMLDFAAEMKFEANIKNITTFSGLVMSPISPPAKHSTLASINCTWSGTISKGISMDSVPAQSTMDIALPSFTWAFQALRL